MSDVCLAFFKGYLYEILIQSCTVTDVSMVIIISKYDRQSRKKGLSKRKKEYGNNYLKNKRGQIGFD